MRQLRLGMCAVVLFGSASAAQDVATARTGFILARTATAAPPAFAIRQPSDTNLGQMLATGMFAAVVGVVGGAYVGYRLETPRCGNDAFFCGLAGAILGGVAGSTVMIPVGIHLVSGHSSFMAKLGMSALMLPVVAAIAVPTHGVGAIALPPAQLIATIWLEHRAGRRHDASMGAHDH